jgi:hypothetical protein
MFFLFAFFGELMAIQATNDTFLNRTVSNNTVAETQLSTNSTEVGKADNAYTAEACRKSYGSRIFRADSGIRKGNARSEGPPLLLSIPGSGNTWSRLLLEHATGIYTGSIYEDKRLFEVLPGEKKCGNMTVASKAHPFSLTFVNSDKTHKRACLKMKEASSRAKCKLGGVPECFDRALIVIRDPFHSIWSEYNRQFATGHRGDHDKGILLSSFRPDTAKKVYAERLVNSFVSQWKLLENVIANFPSGSFAVIKYENLINPAVRTAELQKAVNFLGVTGIPTQRIECAFNLSESPKVHRSIDGEKMVTIDIAYESPITVCSMWRVLSTRTSIAGYGYTPWNNTDCSKIPKEKLYSPAASSASRTTAPRREAAASEKASAAAAAGGISASSASGATAAAGKGVSEANKKGGILLGR